ncbi:MAG: hypothetical protein PHD43_23340 [Methylococcales bacterium]|nr:hypothetical protein [Candidatus Paceibacterota bacterium]MDD5323483.1 hypothetical protein [Methylococcales bacterium]
MTEPTNWLDEEIKNTQTEFTGEKLPTLKLEVGKITTFTVDFSIPFNKWTGESGKKKVTKAIIPVTQKGEKKNLWLNVQNPLYSEICKRGKAGQKEFKVSTTGTQSDTRYTIVEEA